MNHKSMLSQVMELLQNPKIRLGLLISIPFILLFIYIGAASDRRGSFTPRYVVNDNNTFDPSSFFTKTKEESAEVFVPLEINTHENNTYSSELSNKGVYEHEDSPEYGTAIAARSKLDPHLPIYVLDFEASNGRVVDINIFVVPGDRRDTVRLEIYGINYQNREVREEYNGHVTAFKEAFEEAKRRIEDTGVSVSDLNFIFGTRDHIQKTASYWVTTHDLL